MREEQGKCLWCREGSQGLIADEHGALGTSTGVCKPLAQFVPAFVAAFFVTREGVESSARPATVTKQPDAISKTGKRQDSKLQIKDTNKMHAPRLEATSCILL